MSRLGEYRLGTPKDQRIIYVQSHDRLLNRIVLNMYWAYLYLNIPGFENLKLVGPLLFVFLHSISIEKVFVPVSNH